MPGRLRSSSTMSGDSSVAIFSPDSPSSAFNTRYPSSAKYRRISWETDLSSSMTKATFSMCCSLVIILVNAELLESWSHTRVAYLYSIDVKIL